MSGWFAVNRKLVRSEFWTSERFTRPQAWVDLLGLAAYEDGPQSVGKATVFHCKRGQYATACNYLANRWRWDRSTVKRFLKELEKQQRIQQQTFSNGTVITVINYDRYQSGATTNAQQAQQHAQQQTHSKRNNMRNNRRNTSKEINNKTNQQSTIKWGGDGGGLNKFEQANPGGIDDPMQDVIDALESVGMTQIETLLGEFSGSRPEAMAIIQHWRDNLEPGPPAWGLGALRNFLRFFRPEGSVTVGWPDPCEEHLRAKARIARDIEARQYDKQQAVRIANREKAQQQREADRVTMTKANELTEPERVEILNRRCPDWNLLGTPTTAFAHAPYFREEFQAKATA